MNILLSGNIFKYFSVLLRKLQYEAPRKYLQYLQVLPSKIVQCEARGIIWPASACLSGRRGQCSGKDEDHTANDEDGLNNDDDYYDDNDDGGCGGRQ